MLQITERYFGKIPKEQNKPVIFERIYGVIIGRYSTTAEVDRYIESVLGRKLRIIDSKGHGIVPDNYIFLGEEYDINRLFNKTIEDIED